MAFNISSLPTYVEEHAGELLAKSVFDAPTVSNVTIQTGVKGATTLNLLDVNVTFGDGSACGFEAEGDDTISQRTINAKHVKVNKEWCDKDLIGKYAQYEVVSAATGKELPFEAELMAGVADGIASGVEKMIWDGDTSLGVDGLAYIACNDCPNQTTHTPGTSFWGDMKKAYQTLPANVITKNDLTAFVAPDKFEELVFELTDANLYHYQPTDETGVITMPGTGVKIVRTPGLANQNNGVVALFARKSNLFYGVDTASDTSDFDLWYSKDNRTFRLSVEFVIGNQIAFPDEVALIKE